ncbi:MAG TPA: response regulator transcription factor [Cryomorphaceae bacterium]|nr:response regulator transcription factor [Cryomorphaceae bacterium]
MKNIRILLVEDDLGLGFVIQDTLREAGYAVHLCRDGKEGLKQFNTHAYDLCLLDVMLPGKDGFELARDIRKVNPDVPIVFLTAKSVVSDKVEGFKAGGDDYITKPFSNEEFLLRIEALLRRTHSGSEETDSVFALGKYRFDPENLSLSLDGTTRTLTKKESGILKILAERKNRVIERELLTNLVWGDDSYFVGRSLDVFITKLRKYLAEDPQVSITNVHGVGFKLEVEGETED